MLLIFTYEYSHFCRWLFNNVMFLNWRRRIRTILYWSPIGKLLLCISPISHALYTQQRAALCEAPVEQLGGGLLTPPPCMLIVMFSFLWFYFFHFLHQQKFDYDSSTVRKRFFREALLQIFIPYMLKQLSPSCTSVSVVSQKTWKIIKMCMFIYMWVACFCVL